MSEEVATHTENDTPKDVQTRGSLLREEEAPSDVRTEADDFPAPQTVAGQRAEEYYFSLSSVMDYVRAQSYDSQLVTTQQLLNNALAPSWIETPAYHALLLACLQGENTAEQAAIYAVAAIDQPPAAKEASEEAATDTLAKNTQDAQREDFLATFQNLPPLEANDVARLDGAQTSYYYARSKMSDPFAQWTFLSLEDDPLTIFAYVIREDSRVYPRPTPPTSFMNPPFNLTDEDIVTAWKTAQTHEEYADLATCEASNGDVYYYSTKHLTGPYARSLAEYQSVERFCNP